MRRGRHGHKPLTTPNRQETNMNKPTTSLSMLLKQVESEIETANGRTVRLCRDPHGGYWIVEGAERVMSVSEFAGQCKVEAREFCAQARAEAFRGFVAGARDAMARVAKSLRPAPKIARA